MNSFKLTSSLLISALALCGGLTGCTNSDPNPEQPGGGIIVPPPSADPMVYSPGTLPTFSYSIAPYTGRVATDATNDLADPSNPDVYHEYNDWSTLVTVTYSGASATVTSTNPAVTYQVNGADVNLNLADTYASVAVTGRSDNGSLRIDGTHRHRLQLNALQLKSLTGPAINDQNRKRVFVTLDGDTRLEDAATYGPAMGPDEDRKGCFFAEGHVIISGSGMLRITGRQRHGLATDGFLLVRPGATLVVDDAAKNAIHVKGSLNAGYGIMVMGGYIYANTSAPAGKAMKSDQTIMINGGTLSLNCSGQPATDPDDNTLSSAACIKTDATLYLNGGTINLTATGDGGKGINVDGPLVMNGSLTTVALSGDHLSGDTDTATPKGVKSGGAMTGAGGRLNVSAIGRRSMALDCAGPCTLSGSILYCFGTSYGLRTAGALTLRRGVLVAGGAKCVPASLAGDMTLLTFSLADTSAESSSLILAPDGTLVGSIGWPVAMADGAALLFASEEVSEGTAYTLQQQP